MTPADSNQSTLNAYYSRNNPEIVIDQISIKSGNSSSSTSGLFNIKKTGANNNLYISNNDNNGNDCVDNEDNEYNGTTTTNNSNNNNQTNVIINSNSNQYLNCKSSVLLDDVDSGIHELNEMGGFLSPNSTSALSAANETTKKHQQLQITNAEEAATVSSCFSANLNIPATVFNTNRLSLRDNRRHKDRNILPFTGIGAANSSDQTVTLNAGIAGVRSYSTSCITQFIRSVGNSKISDRRKDDDIKNGGGSCCRERTPTSQYSPIKTQHINDNIISSSNNNKNNNNINHSGVDGQELMCMLHDHTDAIMSRYRQTSTASSHKYPAAAITILPSNINDSSTNSSSNHTIFTRSNHNKRISYRNVRPQPAPETCHPDDISISNNKSSSPLGSATSNETMQQRLCKINVLLLTMKVLLGSTMTALSVYLYNISQSMSLRDCSFWASIPLLISGFFDMALLKVIGFRRAKRKTVLIFVLCSSLSFICVILCIIASIFTGIHGNWISGHSDECFPDSIESTSSGGLSTPCCYNKQRRLNRVSSNITSNHSSLNSSGSLNISSASSSSSSNSSSLSSVSSSSSTSPFSSLDSVSTSLQQQQYNYPILQNCVCREAINYYPFPTLSTFNKKVQEDITMEYVDLSCWYVFSAVKDYLILQCALMAVGCGVSLWLLQITVVTFYSYMNNVTYKMMCTSYNKKYNNHKSNKSNKNNGSSSNNNNKPNKNNINNNNNNNNSSSDGNVSDNCIEAYPNCSRQSPILPVKLAVYKVLSDDNQYIIEQQQQQQQHTLSTTNNLNENHNHEIVSYHI